MEQKRFCAFCSGGCLSVTSWSRTRKRTMRTDPRPTPCMSVAGPWCVPWPALVLASLKTSESIICKGLGHDADTQTDDPLLTCLYLNPHYCLPISCQNSGSGKWAPLGANQGHYKWQGRGPGSWAGAGDVPALEGSRGDTERAFRLWKAKWNKKSFGKILYYKHIS